MAPNAREEFLSHCKVARAYGEIVNMGAVAWIRYTVPDDMINTKLTIAGTAALAVHDFRKIVQQLQ